MDEEGDDKRAERKEEKKLVYNDSEDSDEDDMDRNSAIPRSTTKVSINPSDHQFSGLLEQKKKTSEYKEMNE